MKYFDIVGTAVGRLNFRLTNKAVPVLMATENLLEAGWEGRPLNDGDLDIVCAQYPDHDRFRLVAQLIGLENLKLNSSIPVPAM